MSEFRSLDDVKDARAALNATMDQFDAILRGRLVRYSSEELRAVADGLGVNRDDYFTHDGLVEAILKALS